MATSTNEITAKNLRYIGKTMTAIRKAEGIGQTVLAKKMGKEQSFISNAEKSVNLPSMKTIVNYFDKLGYKIVIQKK